ncbi:hypothetical protein J0670_35315, partial [Streptomyces sp. FH025]|nr:hypothetical protein [Streptomyces sp. FH025]
RVDNQSVFYDSPDRLSLVQVWPMEARSPYEEAAATDTSLTTLTSRFPEYHRIRLEQTADGGAELEYSYNLSGSGVRHSVAHFFTGPDGVAWAILVAGPETGGPAPLHALLQSELTSFCFTGHCPPASG